MAHLAGMPPSLRSSLLVFLALTSLGLAQINTVQTIAPDVYFHEGDPRRGHSNNGWIVFPDYIVVIDANYPSGAKELLPKVRASSPKPIRFVVDTHQHADHSYGNQLWADEGATVVAHQGVLAALRLPSAASDWAGSAKGRPDVAATKLRLPSVVFPDTLIFDDGDHTVELHWLGVAHTQGDTFVWLPKEKILFTGDACVNGPSNNVRDGNIGQWIKTLEAAKRFGAEKVCPGHGPMGGPEIIADQQAYFIALRDAVQSLIAEGKSGAEVKAAAPALAAKLKEDTHIRRYVQTSLLPHLSKVYTELTGKALPNAE